MTRKWRAITDKAVVLLPAHNGFTFNPRCYCPNPFERLDGFDPFDGMEVGACPERELSFVDEELEKTTVNNEITFSVFLYKRRVFAEQDQPEVSIGDVWQAILSHWRKRTSRGPLLIGGYAGHGSVGGFAFYSNLFSVRDREGVLRLLEISGFCPYGTRVDYSAKILADT